MNVEVTNEKELEKKAEKLLDEEQDEQKEENSGNQEEQPKMEPREILRELCRGSLRLMIPFRAHSQDVEEVPYDFCDLTNEEMLDALDSVPVNNLLAISNAQAMALFAATAAKCAPNLTEGNKTGKLYDARDVKRGLYAADAVKAIQAAKLFYQASSQAGGRIISKK